MKNKVYARIIAGVMAVTMLVQTAVPSSATEKRAIAGRIQSSL